MKHFRAYPCIVLASLAALLSGGCATSAPRATFSQPAVRVTSADQTKVEIVPLPGVALQEFEIMRLASQVRTKLEAMKAMNPSHVGGRSYDVTVRLSRYDKGNAFARAMLAGLGQIHINAVVSVYELPGRAQVGEFTIKKTFAWGGIYGGSTSMEDVEVGFAEGIAAALTKPAEGATQSESVRRTAPIARAKSAAHERADLPVGSVASPGSDMSPQFEDEMNALAAARENGSISAAEFAARRKALVEKYSGL